MSYSDTFSTPLDEVRHLIGDTDDDAPILTDAEIMYELGKAGDVVRTAALGCCRALMARYAGLADTTELDLSVKASQLFDHYQALGNQLIADAAVTSLTHAVPYAGGLSVRDRNARNANTDRRVPFIDRPFGRPFRDMASDWRCC